MPEHAPVQQLHPRAAEARDLDDRALLEAYHHAPGVLRANFVATVDGSSSTEGAPGQLGGDADRRVFGLLRRLCDVVLVGAGTARDAGYGPLVLGDASARWRTERGDPAHPVLALASRSLRLDPTAPLFRDAPVRPVVLTVASAPDERRAALADVADVVDCGDDEIDVARLRRVLADRRLHRVLCEGGPSLLGELVAADAVDELCLTVAPKLEGGLAPRIATRDGAPVALRDLDLARVLVSDGTLLTTWRRRR